VYLKCNIILDSREEKLDKGMNVTYPMPVVNLHRMHYLNFKQAAENFSQGWIH